MVAKLPDQPDTEFITSFSAFDRVHSCLIRPLNGEPTMSLWECAINQRPDATGYWIGAGEVFHAFLVAQPLSLSGMHFLEVLRAWVEPDMRGKGLFSTLMKEASRRTPLLSDREGMSRAAFAIWSRSPGKRWYDMKNHCYVEEQSIPAEDKYGYWEDARRWQIVLPSLEK
ncbi:hypothetical protein BG58_37735 [Caballeronia jiangsuensis]|nr:hypothetical protein BG58_37735 [Caballeronia jiangsuensis]